MNALHDIFVYALPSTVFLFGAVVLLLLCAAAALWPWRATSKSARRAGPEARDDYPPRASSIVGP